MTKQDYSNILKILPRKIENFQIKKNDILHISAQNIHCGYSLELPRRSGSNVYPQSMFLNRNKKNNVYPCKLQIYYTEVRFNKKNNVYLCKPQFYYIKAGFKGFKII